MRTLVRSTLCLLLMTSMFGCASQGVPKRLSRAEVGACKAQGGYESRSAFGYAICQTDFADAGKICSSKSDCEGQCLAFWEQVVEIGTVAKGSCEAKSYTPGCYAIIENGKVASAPCVD